MPLPTHTLVPPPPPDPPHLREGEVRGAIQGQGVGVYGGGEGVGRRKKAPGVGQHPPSLHLLPLKILPRHRLHTHFRRCNGSQVGQGRSP